jgi:hypothetical protein
MGKKIPEVDAYIEDKAADFAKPLLKTLRRLFHKGCPQAQEVIKWGAPYFEFHGLLGCMVAFKQHVGFGLWRGKEIPDPYGVFEGAASTQMSGLKLSSKDDLPPDDVLLDLIRSAAALNEKLATDPATKAAAKKASAKRAKKTIRAPADLSAALKQNKAAAATYKGFPYSKKKEYVEWITDAKRQETRDRRVAQAVELMAEGKSKNWKYENC